MSPFIVTLAVQAAAVADTVLFRQVPQAKSVFEQIVFVAAGLTSILTLVVVVVALTVLIGLKVAAKQLGEKLDEVLIALRPLTQNVNATSSDLREAAAVAKAMMLETRDTVTEANLAVREHVEVLSERISDLTDIVGRILATATRVAGVGATAMGGIKAGARFFGIGRKKKPVMASARGARVVNGDRPRLRQRD